MGSPYNNIDTRVEAALAEVITEAVSGSLGLVGYGVIRTGLDDDTTEENCIICHVDAAEEHVPRSGIWNVNCAVIVNTNMDTSNSPGSFSNHKSNVGKIRDLFMDDALPATLTATDESILVSGVTSYSITNETEGRFAVGSIRFGIIAGGL